MKAQLLKLEKFARRRWYTYVVAFLAALDAFVFFVPNEALLITAVLARPKRWIRISLWVSVGSAVGAAAFGYLASIYGEAFVTYFFPSILNSRTWLETVRIIHSHGAFGLALVSLSPLPQHAAVAIAGLAHVSVRDIFLGVILGRTIKYLFVAWCSTHAPKLLRSLRILPKKKPST